MEEYYLEDDYLMLSGLQVILGVAPGSICILLANTLGIAKPQCSFSNT